MDFRHDRDRAPLSQINVTPLVDVMLVLLIIFMVTASIGQQGINVNLPRAHSEPLQAQPDVVTVSIDKTGQVWLNTTRVTLSELRDQLKSQVSQQADKVVYLKSDASVSYGDFIRVVSAVKAAGVERLGMMTDVPKN
jgi:biopolymer transport protein TolR